MNNTTLKKSSILVKEFLEKNNVHKKEFAKMIGVTLSYVYNLIDENVPFSTRSTTLERIATVMGINPEEFIEYQIPSEVISFEKNLLNLKDLIKENNLTALEFIKKFEAKKRLEMVDILRGAHPIGIDFDELKKIGNILNMSTDEVFEMWKTEFIQYLKKGKFNADKNKELLDRILECAHKAVTTVYGSQ